MVLLVSEQTFIQEVLGLQKIVLVILGPLVRDCASC